MLVNMLLLLILLTVSYAIGCVAGRLIANAATPEDDAKSDAPSAEAFVSQVKIRTTPTQQLAASLPPAPQTPVSRTEREPRSQSVSRGGAPAALAAPRGGRMDNLRRIKGIGPRFERELNDLGVFHFDQVAAWDADTVAWLEARFSAPGRISRERWVAQARDLAEGGEETHRLRA